MQTPEEFAAIIADFTAHSAERAADLIRTRDAEITEQVRAETLAGFGWEYGFRDDRGRNYRLNDQEVGAEIPAVFTLTHRLFGPWEPVEP